MGLEQRGWCYALSIDDAIMCLSFVQLLL